MAGYLRISTLTVIKKALQYHFSKSKMQIALEVSLNLIGHQRNQGSMRATRAPSYLIWQNKDASHASSPNELSGLARRQGHFLEEMIYFLKMSRLTKRAHVGPGLIRAITISLLIVRG